MLKNKIVRIEDPFILRAFYPEFVVKSEFTSLDYGQNIIYTGRYSINIIKKLKDESSSFICTAGPADVDLTTSVDWIKLMESKSNRKVSESVKLILNSLELSELIYYCKVYWCVGQWPYEMEESKVTIYNLFQATLSSLHNLFTVYFQLLESYPYYIIESSFFTFLLRAKTLEFQNLSPHYSHLLRSFRERYYSKVPKAVMAYGSSKEIKDEIRFLKLLLALR